MHNYETQYIKTNDIHLHTILAGDPQGEPILLLHGFPEFWYGWRAQIDALAQAGFRVIVPDQRGYNLSDKPPHVKDYAIDTLAGDVVGLIDALGYDKVTLVGHDWGAAVAWWVATLYPNRLHRLAILNVPYPPLMFEQIRSGNYGQLLKSWYIGFFQIPVLPEALLTFNNHASAVRALQSSSRKGTFTPEDLALYRQAWSQPNAVKSMLNWYRAALRRGDSSGLSYNANHKNPVPTLILWGENDAFLSPELAQMSADLCEDVRLVYFKKTTHWIQHERPEKVNEHLINFARDVKPVQGESN